MHCDIQLHMLKAVVQERSTFSMQSHQAFYILNTVAHNVLHSQGSHQKRYTFWRQSHRIFHIFNAVIHSILHFQCSRTECSNFSRQSHGTFYILKSVRQNCLHSQSSRIKRCIFSGRSITFYIAFYNLKAVTHNVYILRGSLTDCSKFSK